MAASKVVTIDATEGMMLNTIMALRGCPPGGAVGLEVIEDGQRVFGRVLCVHEVVNKISIEVEG